MLNPDIKIIFVDIDWTIYNHRHSLHVFDEYSILGLKEAQKEGVKVYICSSRPFHTIKQTGLLNMITPDGVIAANGGVIFEGNKIIYEDIMPKDMFHKLCAVCLKHNLCLEGVSARDAFLINKKNKYVSYVYSSFYEAVPPIKDYHHEKIVTALLFASKEEEELIKDELPNELSLSRFHDYGVDVCYNGHYKGDGVKRVLDYYHFVGDEAMAIGDDYADLDMFKCVKYSIAMLNGRHEVKNHALFVTKDIDESGVLYALKHYNIIRSDFMKENLGILLPVASLPGRHGIGDFGESSYRFISWLKKSHYKYWQILPLNPLGPGDSPYMSTCSEAIDYRYISLDLVTEMGLLDKVPSFKKNAEEVDYTKVKEFKRKWLFVAYEKYMLGNRKELRKFIKDNPWVIKYATFEVFKELNNDKPWNKWKVAHRDYYLRHVRHPKKYETEIYFIAFMQYLAHRQYKDVLAYARKIGVKLIADMPFYVGFDSIDVWLHRDEFLLDEQYNQTYEGGVPPDAFSDVGQLWGSPIYNFEKMKQNGYSLMVHRTGFLASMCDYLRLDHFRAFDTYFVIPAGSPDAKNGEWRIGPRTDFFDTLYKEYPNINLIAEDLGDLFPSVLELRDHYHFPGMFIVEFTIFDMKNYSNENLIVYTGTHDNETFYGWYKNLTEENKKFLMWRLGVEKEEDLYDACFYYTLNIPSKMTILPLQDVLKLDNKARLNTPGTVGYPNFVWKLKDFSFMKKVKFENK